MSSAFWGVFAGAVLVGVALIATNLVGRGLARTRRNIADLQRLLENTRRLNADVVAAASEQSPPLTIGKVGANSRYKSWLDE